MTISTKLVVIEGLTYARYLGRKLDCAARAQEPLGFDQLQELLHDGFDAAASLPEQEGPDGVG